MLLPVVDGTTIKNLLMTPKDKDPIQKQSGVIYRYQCERVDCDEEYIGQSSRTFAERFKEHLKPHSPIYDHSNITVTMLPSTTPTLLEGGLEPDENNKRGSVHKGQ